MTEERKKVVRVQASKAEPQPAAPEESADLVAEPVELPAPEKKPEIDWKDTALRLQAEMENYRKRQQRLADERILAEKERLLRAYLGVVDNLTQTLSHAQRDDPLYNGVKVTLDAMLSLLKAEGVAALPTVGQPFDPLIHEAAAMIPAQPGQEPDLLIVAEERSGYRLDERLLRPARVIVAKKS